LKTEGFGELVCGVADAARSAASAADAVRIALTLDGRLDEPIGLAALSSADRIVIDVARTSGVRLDPDADGGDRLLLTRTGRLTVRLGGNDGVEDAYPLGALLWEGTGVDRSDLEVRWQGARNETTKTITAVHDELAREPVDRVLERIGRIEHAVAHMAPVLIYVDDNVYTNLGRLGNLPGKSMAVTDERSLLVRLRQVPVTEWNPADAVFIGCLAALLRSGPPVRAEEFGGMQLNPATLAPFLADLIAGYGGDACPVPTTLAELEDLADMCARLRTAAVAGRAVPCRIINGLTMNKREILMPAPAELADAPVLVRAHVAELLGIPADENVRIDELAPRYRELAAQLSASPAPEGFSSAFEATLNAFVATAAEAFDADTAMSRGPQRFAPLQADHASDEDPLALRTGDFYCCVAPRKAFEHRFGADRAALAKTCSAYSARMRFNTWHYLPHTLGIVEREPGRDDWFFAPTMPDVTVWSDQHHTGHVTFGVRYAIRVPFGIEFDGRVLPGLYDLRLMRTSSPPFTLDELRGAIATAWLLRGLYQAMSEYKPEVLDFDNGWYQRTYG
jgi:hypothetical protein